jgi:hypothetical protein
MPKLKIIILGHSQKILILGHCQIWIRRNRGYSGSEKQTGYVPDPRNIFRNYFNVIEVNIFCGN